MASIGWQHYTSERGATRPWRIALPWLALVSLTAAALVALPMLSVLSHLLDVGGEAWAHVASLALSRYLPNTLILLFAVGTGCLLLGVAGAWLVVFCRFPGRRVFEWALILPLAVPGYILAYVYYDFLSFSGPVQSGLRALFDLGPREYWFPTLASVEGAAVLLIFGLYPYVYLAARASFTEQSVCVFEVSRSLGCTPWTAARRVMLPMARPAIVTGLALALMETLADFGTVSLLGVGTFTTGIYRAWFAMGDHSAAAALAACLLTAVFALLALERWSRANAGYHHTTSRYRQLPEFPLSGWQRGLAWAVCTVPVVFGFVLPVALLLEMTVGLGVATLLDPRFIELLGNSLSLGAVTAALAVGLALVMIYGARARPNPVARGANRLAAMGYAVPGPVIAVGTLLPLAWFDNALNRWLEASLGVSTGLLLTGSIAALVFAYLVRFMTVALGGVESGFARLTPSLDDVGRALGVSPARRLWRIHVPLLSGSLLTAGLIVFVDVMKELPATLVLRPFNFDTLAVRVYDLARDERIAEASAPALVLVALGLVPVILLSRRIARSRPGARREAEEAVLAPAVPADARTGES